MLILKDPKIRRPLLFYEAVVGEMSPYIRADAARDS
jgi:hypothetical protein